MSSAGLLDEDLDQFVSQTWDRSGNLVYSSLADIGPPLQAPGHHIVTWQGQSWRVFALESDQRTIQVAVTTKVRRRHFYSLTPWLLIPLALLIVTLAVLSNEGVNRVLDPLEGLRRDIAKRSPQELQPFDPSGQPAEIAPLVRTLNQLLQRIDHLLLNQRRFLADAAHELNTRLAAVKLQAQLVRRSRDQERDAALDELDAGIERASRLASQLLQLARLEPEARQPQIERFRLDDLARQAVAAFSARAEELGSDLGIALAEPVSIHADPHAVRTLLDNLIGNALTHTLCAVMVDVKVWSSEGHAHLEVSDNGPGVAPGDRGRVMERFVRLSPGDGKGSGLGLAIVREIAALHGGTVDLSETPGGGLTVHVALPMNHWADGLPA